MSKLRAWLLRLVAVFGKKRRDCELADELESHLQMHVEDNLRSGMTLDEARRQAVLKLGGVEQTKESYRDRRGVPLIETLLQDTRLALRLLRRAPGVTAIALLSITLSVGATAVVFTAIKSVVIDPLPYAHPEELVQIRAEFANDDPSQSHTDWAFWSDAQEIGRRTRTLEAVGIYNNAIFNLGGDASTPPEALYGLQVSANLFPTLGVSPMLGRNILPEEDEPGHSNEMILSYGLWTRRFNSDRSIVGRSVSINGHDCLVIGVMPPEFNFPLRRAAAHTPSPYVEFWAPRQMGPDTTRGALGVVARLRPGATLFQAQQELASISNALSQEFPATNRDHALRLGLLQDRALGSARKTLWFLMVASAMFLLIGCANVANLQLARGLVRQREIAIRVAIGASPARIIRQLLTESCLLAVLGGAGGYVLTVAAWKILPAVVPVSIPRLAAARADWQVLAFTIMVALANGILFGMAPALRAGRTRVFAMHDFGVRGAGSGKRNRIRGALVALEVAITISLVVVGGQFLGNLVELLRTDPGFDADHILAAVVIPTSTQYRTPQYGVLYRKFYDSVRALPGVESAGTVDALPFSGENHGGLISTSASQVLDPRHQTLAEVDLVSAEYLQTMGVHLGQGRWFGEEEMGETNDSAIVNDVAARRLWPGASAIGKRVCVYCTPEMPNNWKQIIGVVSTIRHVAMDGPQAPNVYLSAGALESASFLVVRTNRPIGDLEMPIRRAIAGVDPHQPVLFSASMRALVADSLAEQRFIVNLLTVIGCLALAMSVAGVYGVTSYIASRRTQEIGIRMALGASPGNVQYLVFRQGFLTAGIGVVTGTVLTLFLMRILSVIGLRLETEHLAYAWLAVGVVVLTAAIACWVPARRGAKTDPMIALRHE